MNDMLDHDAAPAARGDRELTLGTGTLLGIFLGLVVLCGACFGVGYTMGHKSQPTPLALNDAAAGDVNSSAGAGYKPPAGSPMEAGSAAVSSPAPPPVVVTPRPAPVVRRPPPPAATTPATPEPTTAAPPVTRSTESARTPVVKPVPPSALLPSANPAPVAAGSIMVQVAAVSHQEDADLLIGALHARGYTVSARHAPTDSLIHVQVGPFSSKPAAEAMRQRLIGDGYNAMLKY